MTTQSDIDAERILKLEEERDALYEELQELKYDLKDAQGQINKLEQELEYARDRPWDEI